MLVAVYKLNIHGNGYLFAQATAIRKNEWELAGPGAFNRWFPQRAHGGNVSRSHPGIGNQADSQGNFQATL
jgi:hypothetical protein